MSDGEAALALYAAHRSALMSYASGIVGDRARAEDIVQEAWLRFDSATTTERVHEAPVGYLYRIVRNLAVDCRRHMLREKGLVEEGADDLKSVSDGRASPEAQAAARDELRLLIQVMDELPERTRIALEMRRIEGAKFKDIARRLGVSVPVAHSIVAEGIAYCRRRVRPLR